MRNNPTFAERSLWYSLKGKQLRNYDFDRQKPAGNYIFDFCCTELKLFIELDGEIHEDKSVKENDYLKEKYAESIGFNLLRFTNEEVTHNGNLVIHRIEEYIEWFERDI